MRVNEETCHGHSTSQLKSKSTSMGVSNTLSASLLLLGGNNSIIRLPQRTSVRKDGHVCTKVGWWE